LPSPGYIVSDMTPESSPAEWKQAWLDRTPARRMGRQSELAGAVLYLLSPAASFTTGAELIIDGGYTCY
jgi:NAD(P)-dependent dehydrogenase (short-subunit alcohol dehydrogenase family)